MTRIGLPTAGDERSVADIRLVRVGVSAKSNWTFVELELGDGAVGLGEATLHGYEPLLEGFAAICRAALVGRSLADAALWLEPGRARPVGLAAHAVISALEQARCDLEASAAGRPIWAWLGADAAPSVPLYANLNRGLVSRTPEAFAAQARTALADGFGAVKIAPFDGVTPDAGDGAGNEAALRAGLARIAAVREAIGDARLLVDCHWRLTAERAHALIGELAEFAPYWLECPIAEQPQHFADLAKLRTGANAGGTLLAGAETAIGLDGFVPYLDLYDVIMPDIKYCGGPAQMIAIADVARERGVRVAPHNPSGPVCHAHSVHASAHPAIDLLELQYGESPPLPDAREGPAARRRRRRIRGERRRRPRDRPRSNHLRREPAVVGPGTTMRLRQGSLED